MTQEPVRTQKSDQPFLSYLTSYELARPGLPQHYSGGTREADTWALFHSLHGRIIREVCGVGYKVMGGNCSNNSWGRGLQSTGEGKWGIDRLLIRLLDQTIEVVNYGLQVWGWEGGSNGEPLDVVVVGLTTSLIVEGAGEEDIKMG